MKKRQPSANIESPVCREKRQTTILSHRLTSHDLYTDATPRIRTRRVNHTSEKSAQKDPPRIPRLVIRGLVGGSIRLDLRGVAVGISEAAFAFWVPDESLRNLHIHHGDIAFIDPMRSTLQKGNLVLLELNGSTVLRRLAVKKSVWYAETVDGTNSKPVPLLDHSVCGIALGFVRLLTKVKAIEYDGTISDSYPCRKRRGSRSKTDEHARSASLTAVNHTARYSKPKRPPFVLAAEKPSPYRLSESGKKFHSARANTR